MLILSDIHGAYHTMLRLLNQCAARYPGERLAFGGDLIDRGPNSRKVVEFAMENAIPTCFGNHEDLCLAYSAHRERGYRARCSHYYDRDVWLWNGGQAALSNWPLYRDLGDGLRPYRDGDEIPSEVLDWMQALPAYLIPDEPLDENGKRLLVSHTGYGLEADHDTRVGWYGALWGRHPGDGPFPKDEYYRVFGHNRGRTVLREEDSCMIDTGAAYEGFGTMTAFHWPSKEVVQQAFDETPVEATFKMVEGRLT